MSSPTENKDLVRRFYEEPTNRRVEFTSTAILRIRDGEIAAAWDEVDLLGLTGQLAASG